MRPLSKIRTRAAFELYCIKHKIELTIERPAGSHGWHVHAYTPDGYLFAGNELHNLTLWHGDRVNWAEVAKELLAHVPLVQCAEHMVGTCDVCGSDESQPLPALNFMTLAFAGSRGKEN